MSFLPWQGSSLLEHLERSCPTWKLHSLSAEPTAPRAQTSAPLPTAAETITSHFFSPGTHDDVDPFVSRLSSEYYSFLGSLSSILHLRGGRSLEAGSSDSCRNRRMPTAALHPHLQSRGPRPNVINARQSLVQGADSTLARGHNLRRWPTPPQTWQVFALSLVFSPFPSLCLFSFRNSTVDALGADGSTVQACPYLCLCLMSWSFASPLWFRESASFLTDSVSLLSSSVGSNTTSLTFN